jgi:hypothetical protein
MAQSLEAKVREVVPEVGVVLPFRQSCRNGEGGSTVQERPSRHTTQTLILDTDIAEAPATRLS